MIDRETAHSLNRLCVQAFVGKILSILNANIKKCGGESQEFVKDGNELFLDKLMLIEIYCFSITHDP